MVPEDEEEDVALEIIKRRVKENAFGFSSSACREMVDESFYDEDVERAISNSALVGIEMWETGNRYVLEGHSMNEDPICLICRIRGDKVRILHVFRCDDDESPNP